MEEYLACVENLDSDLVCARGFHLDIFELEWLACTPAYGSLALDDLPFSSRHDSIQVTEQYHEPLAPVALRRRRSTDYCKSRGTGPSPDVTSHLHVLPKRLLQACKFLSWLFPKQKKNFLKTKILHRFDAGQAGHRNVSRMLRLL
jgi:hypothetical protein